MNCPTLFERGQFTGSAGVGFLGSGLINAQGAYAITQHIGVMGSVMYHGKSDITAASGFVRNTMMFGEGGAGWFRILDMRREQIIETYGGLGLGQVVNHFSRPDSLHINAEFTYHNVFIQGEYVYKPKYFHVGAGLRINYVNFFSLTSSSENLKNTTQYYLNVEPNITLRAGRKFKVFLQTGMTYPLINAHDYFFYNTQQDKKFASLVKIGLGMNMTLRVNKSNNSKKLRWRDSKY